MGFQNYFSPRKKIIFVLIFFKLRKLRLSFAMQPIRAESTHYECHFQRRRTIFPHKCTRSLYIADHLMKVSENVNEFSRIVVNEFSRILINEFSRIVINEFSRIVINEFSRIVVNEF